MSNSPRVPHVVREELDDDTRAYLDALKQQIGMDLNMFLVMAQHPLLFRAWGSFANVFGTAGSITGRDRELVILRSAWRCSCHYQWAQHVGLARREGLETAEINAIAGFGTAAAGHSWGAKDAALLTMVDDLHDRSRVSDASWVELGESFDRSQLIELVMLIGNYHLAAFTLNSTEVTLETGPAWASLGEAAPSLEP